MAIIHFDELVFDRSGQSQEIVIYGLPNTSGLSVWVRRSLITPAAHDAESINKPFFLYHFVLQDGVTIFPPTRDERAVDRILWGYTAREPDMIREFDYGTNDGAY